MKLPLAYYGDPILRRKATVVERFDEELKRFYENMEETMIAHDGLGLAAPQVKRSIRMFLINIPEENKEEGAARKPSTVFINPEIVSVSEESGVAEEGCLSIPKVYEEVLRPLTIEVKAVDLENKPFTGIYTGWEARAILHENDHINGVLFIDRIHGKRRKLLDPLLKRMKHLGNEKGSSCRTP